MEIETNIVPFKVENKIAREVFNLDLKADPDKVKTTLKELYSNVLDEIRTFEFSEGDINQKFDRRGRPIPNTNLYVRLNLDRVDIAAVELISRMGGIFATGYNSLTFFAPAENMSDLHGVLANSLNVVPGIDIASSIKQEAVYFNLRKEGDFINRITNT